MPRISFFYGITIAMFWDESGHQTPHFHAAYSGCTHLSRLTGRSLPAHSRHEPSSSSDNGLHFIRQSSSPTGVGHFKSALQWLEVIERLDGVLPSGYLEKRVDWHDRAGGRTENLSR